MPVLGPYSAPPTLAKLDQRTREARLMRRVRADLTQHCGGSPSATQRALIERAVMLTLRVAQLDARPALNPHDARTYLGWVNTLARVMQALGVGGSDTEAAEPAPPSLHEYLSQRAEA